MSLSRRLWAVVLTAVLALAACGGSDDDSSPAPTTAVEQGGDAGDDAPDNGADTTVSAGSGLPAGAGDDFPIPIPDGWVVDIHARAGLTIAGSIQVLYPFDEYDSIVGFYEEWTTEQPDSYARSETDTFVLFLLASPMHTINISNDYEEQGNRYILVQATAAGG